MARYILALDQGTTSSRAILFDTDGEPLAIAQRELPQIYPKPGWVEHDPLVIWSTQREAMDAVLATSRVSPSELDAIGISNQRETVLIWDAATGAPLHNAIVWQDRRTAEYCDELRASGHEPSVQEKTGLLLDPYFSATKLKWILDQIPGARARAQAGELRAGTVDTWLLWQLSGGAVHATDCTNAARTQLFNINSLQWDEELLDLFEIPRPLLPRVGTCSEVYGHVASTILSSPVPIAGVAGDQHAALFGQACFKTGMAKNTYGTGCFLLLNTGDKPTPSKKGLLTTLAWQIGDQVTYALEGSVFVAGALVQWLRDELGIVDSPQACDALAATVPDANGIRIVPAFTGLGAPHWDPYARGAILGLTRGVNRAHICRAALEAIALQSTDLASLMSQESGIELEELRVDGGASRSDLLMQIQADLLQREVVRPSCLETTALGAAYLAGLATGYWSSQEQIQSNWRKASHFAPAASVERSRLELRDWSRALERSKGWAES